MVVTMPASIIIRNKPWRTGVSGTVWHGEVGVAGGSTLRWDFAPLRSLTSFGLAADWRATGVNTDLGGRILVRPGRWVLDAVSGSADARLIEAAWPDLGFTCDLTMQVEMKKLVLGSGGGQRAEGTIVTDPGACTPARGGTTSPVEALRLTAEPIGNESRIRLTPQTQRLKTLVDASLGEDGTLSVRMTPDGAAALPFTGIPAGASIRGSL